MANCPPICKTCKHIDYDSGFDGVGVPRRQDYYVCLKGRFLPVKKNSCALHCPTKRVPDSSKAEVLSLPESVEVENALPVPCG